MKEETRIVLSALRNFLARPEVEDKMISAVMPADGRLGDLSGKEVDVPLSSVFQGLTHKIGFKDMAKVLDENNDVVSVFLEELSDELRDYSAVKVKVPIKNKEKKVKSISKGLKGDKDEDEESEQHYVL